MKLTRCKICRNEYKKFSISHKTCSPECAIELVNRDKAKKARIHHIAEKLRLKSRREWLKDAQIVVNKFVRKRDDGKPCISCGRHHEGQHHAGHYLSVGAHPALRFEMENIHLQCQPCNVHLSGNILNYRKGLIDKIGISRVEWLEGSHAPKKYTIQDLQEIISIYKNKLKG